MMYQVHRAICTLLVCYHTILLPGVRADPGVIFDTDVLVLGAGISGIAAAQALHQGGVEDFLILEGTNRIGGRIKNIRFHGTSIELGANWIQGVRHNPLTALAKKYGLKGEIESLDYIIRNETGGNTTFKGHHAKYKQAKENVEKMTKKRRENKDEDISLRTGLELVGWNPSSVEEAAVEYDNLDFEYAVPPKYISSRTYMNRSCSIHSTDGEQMFITDQRGYVFLVQKIADEFLKKNDSKLRLNTRVKSIIYDGSKVVVLTDTGLHFTARRALVTFSIGVLKSGAIKFQPDLPSWKSEVIFKLNMVIYTKIFLKFPYKFWDDEEYIYYATKRRGYYPIWQNLEADSRLPKGTNILLLTVTQEEAMRLEYQSDNITKKEIISVLRDVYGQNTPDIIDIHIPKWGLDEFFYGTWANVPIGMSSEDYGKLQRNVKSVYFAGEATHEQYSGYVHGGYITGIDRARDIVRSLRYKQSG